MFCNYYVEKNIKNKTTQKELKRERQTDRDDRGRQMENLREGLKDRKCKSETDMRSERERKRERERVVSWRVISV